MTIKRNLARLMAGTALAGLAAFARTPRFFGLETTGRRWVA